MEPARWADRRIATAFGVPALRLTELAPDGIRIELLHDDERPEAWRRPTADRQLRGGPRRETMGP